jgi:pSer/pThr/pTyr-binding forkhead associated (FHA) protein
MPAKLTLHPPERASRFLVVREGESLVVGRDPACELVLEDPRVSKRHARLEWHGTGWALADLSSKNGTSVDGSPASGEPLADDVWISFGGLRARFERISEQQVQMLASQRLARLQTTVGMRRRLSADLEPFDLLFRLLQSAMELTSAERGFVMVADLTGVLRVEAAAGLNREHLLEPRFTGSVGAVERMLATGASVVVTDAQKDTFLGKRPSVVEASIGVLACVPLRHEGRIVGLIYVDGRTRRDGFTEVDLEILDSLREHAAMLIAGLRLDRRIRNLFRNPEQGAARGKEGLLLELERRLSKSVELRLPRRGTAGPGPRRTG